MIRINLLGTETEIDHSSKLLLGAYVVSLVVLLGVFYFANAAIGSEVRRLESSEAKLKSELDVLRKTTKDVRDLEAKKKELNSKLAVIATLKLSKSGPVRVMDDLNNAIPEKAWLVEATENAGVLKLIGFALDNVTVATFMTNLGASDYFHQVELVQSLKQKKGDVALSSFIMETKVNYAGKPKLKAEQAGAGGKVATLINNSSEKVEGLK